MNNELHIALVQTPIFWESPEDNRVQITNKIAQLPQQTNLVVLPEMFTTGFTMEPLSLDIFEGEKTVVWMKKMAKQKHCAIVGSIPYFENDAYTNRLFFVEPNGATTIYDKRHTFTLAGEHKEYAAGTQKVIVDYLGFSICLLICYDLRFPVWARNTDNYDALLYVANWPKPRIAAWDTLLKARAIENMAYCIGVNRIGTDNLGNEYTGHSAVYNCLGETVVFSDNEEILYATLHKDHVISTRDRFKFLNDRDAFILK